MRALILLSLVYFPTASLTAECPWEPTDNFWNGYQDELKKWDASTQEIPNGISVRNEYFLHVKSIESVKVVKSRTNIQCERPKPDTAKARYARERAECNRERAEYAPYLEIIFNTAVLRFSYNDEKVKLITTYRQPKISIPEHIMYSPILAFGAITSLLPGGDSPVTKLKKLRFLECEHVRSEEVIRAKVLQKITISEMEKSPSGGKFTTYIGSSALDTAEWNKLGGDQYSVAIPLDNLYKDVLDAINDEWDTEIRVLHNPSYPILGLGSVTHPAGINLGETPREYLAKVDLSQFKKQALSDYREKKKQNIEKEKQNILQMREGLRPWNY